MTSVQLRQIDQDLGGNRVLRGLDLTVDSGDYVVLLGPSGCGKTTTLRIIAGLQSPDRGDVFFDCRRVNGILPRKRDVAMVFQHDGLYPHLTIRDSICFALRGRVPAEEMQTRLVEAAQLTRTESILDRYPNRLSGGELRRAAVAKAVARRSSIRLLDEPLSALDAPVRHALQDDILTWHTAVPGTSIHVTHDGQEAMRMADKIAVMEAGGVVQFATPSEIYSRPCSVSVAQAIGSPPINLLRARLRDGRINIRNDRIRCHAKFPASWGDRELFAAVRPEAFQLVSTDDLRQHVSDKGGLVLQAESFRCKPVQRDVHLCLTVGEDLVRAVIPSQDFEGKRDAAEQLQLTVSENEIHWFDAVSSQRI